MCLLGATSHVHKAPRPAIAVLRASAYSLKFLPFKLQPPGSGKIRAAQVVAPTMEIEDASLANAESMQTCEDITR